MKDEASAKELNLAPDGANALVRTLREDPAAIDQALDQLASAFPASGSADLVARQFRGLGEQHIWDLCDRAFSRDLPAAMRSMRTLLEARGGEGLMILGGLAARLRDLIRVRSLPDRIPPAEVAKQAGLRFEWQARRYRDQAGRFTLEELAQVHERLAWADRSLKSGATDDVVLPMVVAAIAGGPGTVPVEAV
jgi:DNA polymerase III delta subunit